MSLTLLEAQTRVAAVSEVAYDLALDLTDPARGRFGLDCTVDFTCSTDTTFLDSTALGVLIGAVKRLRSRDGRLTIVNVDENIAKTFEITGLDQIFPISGTRDEAVKALDADEAPASS